MRILKLIKRAIKAILPYGLIVTWRRLKNRSQKSISRFEMFTASVFKQKFLETAADGKKYFNFNGALIPDISNGDMAEYLTLTRVFSDTFMFPVLFNDNYEKEFVEIMDLYMHEGPYGYTDGLFDVTVKPGDIVIDAGAWIGDFSAYASSKGASVYAFEPGETSFQLLLETSKLNTKGPIQVVNMGLGSKVGEAFFMCDDGRSAGGRIYAGNNCKKENVIRITTLDEFVEKQKIQKVDFIKADVEGSEYDLLIGAKNVLKKFEPKLAICTYHKQDDPEVLERTILEINPKYKIVHLRMKLFACVL